MTESYLALIRKFPLRPIRSEEELDRAVAVIDSLLDVDGLDDWEADYLLVLSGLVEGYEAEIDPVSGLEGVVAVATLPDSGAASGLATF